MDIERDAVDREERHQSIQDRKMLMVVLGALVKKLQ